MSVRPFRPSARIRTDWRLADDGIVDPIAVEIAAKGTRPVQLTGTERLLAAALLLDGGAPLSLVAYRLRMGTDTVRRLAAGFRAGTAAGKAAASAHPEPVKEVA